MGINLSDYIKDPETILTMEEAERLFVTAGYRKRDSELHYEVYDDRTGEVLFRGESPFDCAAYIENKYQESCLDRVFMWVRRIGDEK